jgi:hypothetical protein
MIAPLGQPIAKFKEMILKLRTTLLKFMVWMVF